MNADLENLMKEYIEDGSDCNRAGLKNLILQYYFEDEHVDTFEKLKFIVDFFEENAIKKHEKEIEGEKDTSSDFPFHVENSEGVGCISGDDLDKLAKKTGLSWTDALRVAAGIGPREEMHTDLKFKMGQIDWLKLGGEFSEFPDYLIEELNKLKADGESDYVDDEEFQNLLEEAETFSDMEDYWSDKSVWIGDEYKDAKLDDIDYCIKQVIVDNVQSYTVYVFYDTDNENLIGAFEEHC